MHKSTNSEIKSTTTLGASDNGAGSHNNRLIQSILRVIRKLKIELHADYIVLGQVNMLTMSSSETISERSNKTSNLGVHTPLRNNTLQAA